VENRVTSDIIQPEYVYVLPDRQGITSIDYELYSHVGFVEVLVEYMPDVRVIINGISNPETFASPPKRRTCDAGSGIVLI